MTIEKGQAWGAPGVLPEGGVVLRSDRDVRAVVERSRRVGEPIPPIGLLGGDLCRTVGGVGDEARLHSDEAVRLPVDVVAKYEVGQSIAVGDVFTAGDWVDVMGTSIGRGFQGVMRRWNFAGGTRTHGTHEYRRHGGSIGC
jgi:hypothetical protein